MERREREKIGSTEKDFFEVYGQSLFQSYKIHLLLADLFALDVLLKGQTTDALGFLFP